MEPKKPEQSPGDPNGAHRAKSNDLAMLCYVQASEKLEYDWFAIRLGFMGFLSNWASWAPHCFNLTTELKGFACACAVSMGSKMYGFPLSN